MRVFGSTFAVRLPSMSTLLCRPSPGTVGSRGWSARSNTRATSSTAADHGVNASRYTVKVYVVYGGSSYDMASHSRGSETGRVAVVYVSLDEPTPATLWPPSLTRSDTLGAGDTYDPETSRAIHPEGFVEPFSKPLFPQNFAELMAVDVPISRTREMEVSTLDQIVWVTDPPPTWDGYPRSKPILYTPAEKGPEDRLVTEETESAPQTEPEPPQGDG